VISASLVGELEPSWSDGPNSLATTAWSIVRKSAARLGPKVVSNRACARDHLLRAAYCQPIAEVRGTGESLFKDRCVTTGARGEGAARQTQRHGQPVTIRELAEIINRYGKVTDV
jgi:hypothetical protein